MHRSFTAGVAPTARIGPAVTSAYRLALDVAARAVRARPREWKLSADELAGRADEDAAARDPLLYYAAAIARDTGDHARADALLRRALAAGPAQLAWRQEFELQLALADALLRGDPAAARARLAALPPPETEPTYPLLAEAAVLAAEGRRADAEDALLRWRAGAAASPFGRERLEVGNHWALERVDEQLGVPPRTRANEAGVVLDRHGPVTRALMVASGLLIAVASGAVGVAVATGTAGTAAGRAGVTVLSLAFAGIAGYGIGLVARGVRGASRRRPGRSERLEAWLLRLWNAPALLWLPPAGFVLGWWAAGDLGAFLGGGGREPAASTWELLVFWTAWVLQVAAHEGGHAAAALLVGGRVDEIAVGPVRWFRDGTRWRWARRPAGLFFGGHVRASVPDPWGRARLLLHVAAGPAVSAGIAVACAIPVLSGAVHDDIAMRVLRALIVTGGWGALTSLVPSRSPLGHNDARIVLEALRGGFWHGSAGTRLACHLAARRRAAEWDLSAPEIERAARASRDGAGWGFLLAAARALDGGEPSVARRLLSELLASERVEPALRNEALLQTAHVDALLDGDATRARARIAEARRAGSGDYARLAEAAAACADGALDDARAALDAWLALADAAEDPEVVRVGNHWAIDAIAARLEASPADAAAG